MFRYGLKNEALRFQRVLCPTNASTIVSTKLVLSTEKRHRVSDEALYSAIPFLPINFKCYPVFYIFSVKRARSTVHNWVYNADLQIDSRKNPDHVAVDETVIQLNHEQYWLYAAVDPETNELLHTSLEPTTNTVIVQSFLAEISEKHDVFEAVFLVYGSHS